MNAEPNVAFSEQILKSQAVAKPQPPPKQTPLIAAIERISISFKEIDLLKN